MKVVMNVVMLLLSIMLLTVGTANNTYAQIIESYEDETPSTSVNETPNTENTGGKAPIVLDGLYERNIHKEREILTYQPLREADIFWQKRIWRMIDTRQKMNQVFSNPQNPLISILLEIIKEKEDAPIFMDESFKEQISYNDVIRQLGSVDTITVWDPDTDDYHMRIIQNDFDWTSVNKFRLKEDWVFDENTSTMMVRILGIAPIRDITDDNGNYRGQQAMFWMYYPDFRKHLVKYETFNAGNDGIRLSWDDLFEMRHFTSTIMKESNIHDRRIQDYATGRDALIEAEGIKQKIFEMEHNLWSY